MGAVSQLRIALPCLVAVALACPWSASGQQSDQSSPQTTSAPRQPLPNRANDVMPSWLRVRGEFRDRMEAPDAIGFVDQRDDVYFLNRFRFDVVARASPAFSVQAQVQDARVADKQVGPIRGAPFRDALDLRMAFADIGDPQASRLTLRVGRQELAFGEQRLVGHLNWTNTARTFDAVRATIRTKAVQVDAFASSVVRIEDGAFDSSGHGNRFVGAYASTTRIVPKSAVEPYVFWRRDENLKSETGQLGNSSVATVGARWAGKVPAGFDYGTEMAFQTGSLASDRVRAWAGHWVIGNTIGGRLKVRVAEEYNYATGDDNPSDGRRQTFDQLYPTGHDKLGLADQVGWRNIHDVRTLVELTPSRGWPVTGSFHSWWLADTHDALYNAAGAVLAKASNAAVSSHVGQELDAQVAHPITSQLQVAAGYAQVFPGAFLKATTPGASYRFPFVMVTYVFLAAK